tara:strand:- start:124 stop:885 length:762 start_codon:yes stop_codon:yes gene_type:complete
MKLLPRIIPSLLLKNGGLVKGKNFKDHVYVGDPINAFRIYNDKEVDEICLLNISNEEKNKIPFNLIEQIASEAFMPFSYGGNINSIENVKRLINLGVEKVVFNSALYENKTLIEESVNLLGSSSVTVSIDYKKNLFGKNKIFLNKKKKMSNLDLLDSCRLAESLGAGEIVACCVDKEGTMSGYDLKGIKDISDEVKIPIIANGGASNLECFKKVIDCGASAASAGSFFVFRGRYKAVMISYPGHKELYDLFDE